MADENITAYTIPKIAWIFNAKKPTELYSIKAAGKREKAPIRKVRKTVIKGSFLFISFLTIRA